MFLSQSSTDATDHGPNVHDSHVYETESLSIRVLPVCVKLRFKQNYVFFGLFWYHHGEYTIDFLSSKDILSVVGLGRQAQ